MLVPPIVDAVYGEMELEEGLGQLRAHAPTQHISYIVDSIIHRVAVRDLPQAATHEELLFVQGRIQNLLEIKQQLIGSIELQMEKTHNGH